MNVKDLSNREEMEVSVDDLIATLISKGVKQDIPVELAVKSKIPAIPLAEAKVEEVVEAAAVEEKTA